MIQDTLNLAEGRTLSYVVVPLSRGARTWCPGGQRFWSYLDHHFGMPVLFGSAAAKSRRL